MSSCQTIQLECLQVEALLQQPENPDLKEAHRTSPLWLASQGNHVEVLRLLLEAGADKNFATKTGITALMHASQEGHVEVSRLLLEAGTGKNSINKRRHGFSDSNPKRQR